MQKFYTFLFLVKTGTCHIILISLKRAKYENIPVPNILPKLEYTRPKIDLHDPFHFLNDPFPSAIILSPVRNIEKNYKYRSGQYCYKS